MPNHHDPCECGDLTCHGCATLAPVGETFIVNYTLMREGCVAQDEMHLRVSPPNHRKNASMTDAQVAGLREWVREELARDHGAHAEIISFERM